jgi:hypothetical protein
MSISLAVIIILSTFKSLNPFILVKELKFIRSLKSYSSKSSMIVPNFPEVWKFLLNINKSEFSPPAINLLPFPLIYTLSSLPPVKTTSLPSLKYTISEPSFVTIKLSSLLS